LSAFALDLFKSRHDLSANDGLLIVVGFAAAFVSGLLVVRSLLNFVSTRDLRRSRGGGLSLE
jgi:undecaprenyl-diphosphatase